MPPAAAATRSSSGWRPASARPTGCSRRARPRQAAGRDVVIGYLEPHERPETEAQAEGLERLPRRRVDLPRRDARGDGPAARSCPRAPELAPDRRARPHQRAGLEHAKRYEDIEDVLDAGIDVFSTVNVQHLEIAQRPGRRADRGPGARDVPGRRPRRGRRGRADRPHARGPDRPPARRQDLPAGADRAPRSTTSSGSRTSQRCARWRCARSPRRSSRSARSPREEPLGTREAA